MIGSLPDSVLEYLAMHRTWLTLSDVACLASTCRRMHTLLPPILHLRFSNVGETVLHFLRRDQQRVLSDCCGIKTLHVRYYPIGFMTLCMTYTEKMTHSMNPSFRYHLWNTLEKKDTMVHSLDDPDLRDALSCLRGPQDVYPISVRWSGLGNHRLENAYPRRLFRVIKRHMSVVP